MMRHFFVVESNTTGTGRMAIERLLGAGERVTFHDGERGGYQLIAFMVIRR